MTVTVEDKRINPTQRQKRWSVNRRPDHPQSGFEESRAINENPNT